MKIRTRQRQGVHIIDVPNIKKPKTQVSLTSCIDKILISTPEQETVKILLNLAERTVGGQELAVLYQIYDNVEMNGGFIAFINPSETTGEMLQRAHFFCYFDEDKAIQRALTIHSDKMFLIRERDGVTILDIIPNRIICPDALTLYWHIKQIIALKPEGELKLLINLAKMSLMDSCGRDRMQALHSLVQRKKGRVALLNLGKSTRQLILMARLMTLFEPFDDEDEAFKWLKT